MSRWRGLGGILALLLVAWLSLPSNATATPAPLSQLGGPGAGAGGLNGPRGVVIDGSGNVLVADRFNNRIDVFTPAGTFIHAFGYGVVTGTAAFEVCTAVTGCTAGLSGGAAGQLANPADVALDGSGRLYVADSNNRRISVFTNAASAPSFAYVLGLGSGTGAGQLSDASGVALDGSGNLYVAEGSNDRISVFNTSSLSFTRAFGFGVDSAASAFEVCTVTSGCEAGDSGSAAGQLNQPLAVTADGSGNLYVAEDGNDRISVFNVAAPSFTLAFGFGVDTVASAFEVCTTMSGCEGGDAGAGAGQIDSPVGVAVDSSGGLYVAEQLNHRISFFNNAGTAPSFAHAYGFGVETVASAFEVCTTMSGCEDGDPGGGFGQFNFPVGVTIDCRGAAWIADGSHRLQRIGEPGTALPPCPATQLPPTQPPAAGGSSPAGFDLASAIRKCKKKRGKARKRCIKRAKKIAGG